MNLSPVFRSSFDFGLCFAKPKSWLGHLIHLICESLLEVLRTRRSGNSSVLRVCWLAGQAFLFAVIFFVIKWGAARCSGMLLWKKKYSAPPSLLKRPSGCATSAFLLSNSQNYMLDLMLKTVLLTLITKLVLSLFCFFSVALSQKRNSG